MSSSSVIHGDEFERGDGVMTNGDATGDFTMCTWTDAGGVFLLAPRFVNCCPTTEPTPPHNVLVASVIVLIIVGVEKSTAASTVVSKFCTGGAEGGRIDWLGYVTPPPLGANIEFEDDDGGGGGIAEFEWFIFGEMDRSKRSDDAVDFIANEMGVDDENGEDDVGVDGFEWVE